MDTEPGKVINFGIFKICTKTMNINKSICLANLILLALGCEQEHPDKIDEDINALFAPVLSHYSKMEDSLKYKAAIYLKQNIKDKFHYEITSRNQRWDKILNYSDNLTGTNIELDEYSKKMDSVFNKSILWSKKVEDKDNITSKELIANIDLAFEVWPKPWNEHLIFEEFCKLILPYRSTNEPYDISYRKNQFVESKNLFETMAKEDSLVEVAKELMAFPKDFRYYRKLSTDQSPSDIEIGKMADCKDISNFISSRGRAIGLPIVVDWAIWPNARGRHYWNSLLYNKDSILFADKDFFWGESGRYSLRRKAAKIYRFVWSYTDGKNFNSERRPENIEWLHDSRYEDVTAQYIQTTDINVKLDNSKDFDNSEAYLCVFNDGKWVPVAVSKIDEKNVSFPNVGKENVHVISGIVDGRLIPISQAFSINDDGIMSFHLANEDILEKITLSRKTKLRDIIIAFAAEMIGSRVEFANDINFSNSRTTLSVHDTILTPEILETRHLGAFRYARIISGTGKELQLAEIKFYSDNREIKVRLMNQNNHIEKNMNNVLDDDFVSYFRSESDESASKNLTFDFGKPIEVTGLMVAPRSDVNYIEKGHLYELLYWDKDWKSLGRKIAESKTISFERVPANAVLWLRNLSHGVEEELFLYKKSKQLFWNSSDYLN